ncbi:CotH kinase family protein [Aliiglaciecola sp. M165]|uniref:CotH kinase family protein n=1 Tax=Aliiglaciecola sp. M165 TaxID=2593649 RepID=UPI00117D3C43|nr:CotH kinase family protein [Aliiglaciecola sp. M165]TRY34049.1 PKD domain-containing protein [Aliiglaciecola sp. M165]
MRNAMPILALLTMLFVNQVNGVQNTDFLDDPDHQFWYDINTLPTIRLSFSQSQWDLLLTSSRDDREEVSGDFIFIKEGTEYPLSNIGIKLSGNTSFVLPETNQDPYTQANFTLDFDEFVDDQALRGIAAMKLKRFKDDSTFVHEPLSNQIMHNFGIWTAHSSTYTRVEIKVGSNDFQYFGMYRMNESVNRHEYIDKRFGENNDGGFLWQGNHKAWGIAHFSRIEQDWGGIGDFDQASFEYKGKGSKFEEGKAQLVELATNFTQLEGADFYEYAEQHINVPLLMKGLAAEAVLGHWDGFWGNGNNFMFYIDEQAVLHFIPFDTDNTLGTSLFVDDVGERDPFIFGRLATTPSLVTKLMAIDEYKKLFKTYIKQLVNEDNLMVQAYSVAWINDAHRLIEDHLVNVTGDNQQIIDEPADWANQSSYRLFELTTGKNWYSTRKSAVLGSFKAPMADAGENLTIEVGQTVTFDASASTDEDGSIVDYQWSNDLSGISPSFIFDSAGTFVVSLTVTDDDENTDTDEITITVRERPAVPSPSAPAVDSSGGSSHPIILLLLIILSTSRIYGKTILNCESK